MGSCAAPSAKGDDKFITTDYLQQCLLSGNANRLALGGGEDRTAGHAVSFLKTLVCDKPAKAAGAARKSRHCDSQK
jgi:hypothetical protein